MSFCAVSTLSFLYTLIRPRGFSGGAVVDLLLGRTPHDLDLFFYGLDADGVLTKAEEVFLFFSTGARVSEGSMSQVIAFFLKVEKQAVVLANKELKKAGALKKSKLKQSMVYGLPTVHGMEHAVFWNQAGLAQLRQEPRTLCVELFRSRSNMVENRQWRRLSGFFPRGFLFRFKIRLQPVHARRLRLAVDAAATPLQVPPSNPRKSTSR